MYCPQCGKKLELTADTDYEKKEYECKSCGVEYETDYLGNLRLILPFVEKKTKKYVWRFYKDIEVEGVDEKEAELDAQQLFNDLVYSEKDMDREYRYAIEEKALDAQVKKFDKEVESFDEDVRRFMKYE